jgi:hypothetical protein
MAIGAALGSAGVAAYYQTDRTSLLLGAGGGAIALPVAFMFVISVLVTAIDLMIFLVRIMLKLAIVALVCWVTWLLLSRGLAPQ